VAFEVLDFLFVFLDGSQAFKSPKIAVPAGLGILLARIKVVSTGAKFANHG
jgi:hypothetical protein